MNQLSLSHPRLAPLSSTGTAFVTTHTTENLPVLPVHFRLKATARQRALVRRLCTLAGVRASDETLTMAGLASGVGLSRATMYRRLDGAMVETPGELLREVRMTRAAALLTEGSSTVSEVTYAVGFRAPSHFAACFRARYGTTPSAFAKTALADRQAD